MQRNYVNAGGLFFFTGQVSQVFTGDTLASNLYLQLAASARHDKFEENEEWLQVYLAAMSRFGYGVLRRDIQSIPVAGQAPLWEMLRPELSKWVSTALVDQAQKTLVYLHGCDSDASELLKANTVRCVTTDPEQNPPLCAVSLQLAFIDNESIITQVFLSFQTSSPVSALPFPQVINQALVAGNLKMTLLSSEQDASSYARLREGVLEKLGQRRAELVIATGAVQP